MSGKGSRPRPLSVPQETWAARWQATFRPTRNRVCERCGKPDREVEVGFVHCRPCFDLETMEMGERARTSGDWKIFEADPETKETA